MVNINSYIKSDMAQCHIRFACDIAWEPMAGFKRGNIGQPFNINDEWFYFSCTDNIKLYVASIKEDITYLHNIYNYINVKYPDHKSIFEKEMFKLL